MKRKPRGTGYSGWPFLPPNKPVRWRGATGETVDEAQPLYETPPPYAQQGGFNMEPEFDFTHEEHVEWSRSDFRAFFSCALTLIWNARERLLKKGNANYIGPFLEIYAILYESCPDNAPIERELLDKSDKLLTLITGNGPDLSYLEDKEDEYHFEDEEDDEVKKAKLVANAEKLMGIILALTKSRVEKEEK
jgi:hypothetical protein